MHAHSRSLIMIPLCRWYHRLPWWYLVSDRVQKDRWLYVQYEPVRG